MQCKEILNSKKGFTLIEIMLVIMIISLLIAISIPSVMKARNNSQKKCCIKNLRQIQDAKYQMAMEKNISENIEISMDDLVPYLKNIPYCPAGGSYSSGNLNDAPDCNIEGHDLENF
ncbi:MAG: prepilin-type N-terminal cleavage/methylation domain-containing protein [Armatimonadota bacterium]